MVLDFIYSSLYRAAANPSYSALLASSSAYLVLETASLTLSLINDVNTPISYYVGPIIDPPLPTPYHPHLRHSRRINPRTALLPFTVDSTGTQPFLTTPLCTPVTQRQPKEGPSEIEIRSRRSYQAADRGRGEISSLGYFDRGGECSKAMARYFRRPASG